MFTACLALVVSAISSVAILAAGDTVSAQDLLKVTASDKVMAALWTRRPDSYTLQVVLDRSRYGVNAPPTPTQPVSEQVQGGSGTGSLFVGATIADLRGLDPAFGCRTLKLLDGRRMVQAQPSAAAAPVQPVQQVQLPKPPQVPRVQVWLLRADGTQILPVWQSPNPAPVGECRAGLIADEVLFRFAVGDSAQAVAAAIKIDDEYYIDKLQPLASGSAQ